MEENQQPAPQPAHHTVVSFDQSSEERLLGALGSTVQMVIQSQGQNRLEEMKHQLEQTKLLMDQRKWEKSTDQAHAWRLALLFVIPVLAAIGGLLWLREPQQAVELVKVLCLGLAGIGMKSVLSPSKESSKDRPSA